jgi:hypothetical protein
VHLVLARFRTEFRVLTIAFSDTGASIGEATETLERHGVELVSVTGLREVE